MIQRRRLSTLLLALACAFVPRAAHADPPSETLERLAEALQFLAGHGPARSATVHFDTVISKVDGSDAEEQHRVVEVAIADDGTIDHRTVQVIQDGVDVTGDEEAQAGFGAPSDDEKSQADDSSGEEGSFSVALSLPAGDDLVDYRFGATEAVGGLHVAPFEPVDGKSRKERTKLSVGQLAWDPQTLDPVWVDFSAARNPRFVQSMDCRMEFTRDGAWLYPERSSFGGVGGFLLYKRRMTFEITVASVRDGAASLD